MNKTPAETEKQLALLQDEKALLDEFLLITRNQAELLKKDDIEGFRESLAKRGRLIKKVDELRQKLEAFDNSGASTAVGKLRRSIVETLKEIEKLSDSNREALIKLMTGLSDEIKKLSENQRMLEGYSQGGSGASSEYFDRRF